MCYESVYLCRNFEEIEVRMQIREKKQDKVMKLKFESKIVPKNLKKLVNSKMNLRVLEISGIDKAHRHEVI